MSNEEALEYIELIESSRIFYDEALDYELSSFDLDWLELAKKALESIDRITAERDALLNDLKIAGNCNSCLHNKRENLDGICSRCFIFGEIRWEWRGIEDV